MYIFHLHIEEHRLGDCHSVFSRNPWKIQRETNLSIFTTQTHFLLSTTLPTALRWAISGKKADRLNIPMAGQAYFVASVVAS